MARVEVTPEQFTLVQYDAGVIAGLAEELATKVGLPDDVPIHIEIDEELPLPLTGSTADVTDGRAELWLLPGEQYVVDVPMSERDVRSYGKIVPWNRSEVVEVLGNVNEPGVDTQIIIRKHNIPDAHSDESVEEARRLGTEVKPADIKGRTDFRHVTTVTIDGEHALNWAESWPEGERGNTASIEDVRSSADRLGLDGYVTLVKGWFDQTLPEARHSINNIALLRIDGRRCARGKCFAQDLRQRLSAIGPRLDDRDGSDTCLGQLTCNRASGASRPIQRDAPPAQYFPFAFRASDKSGTVEHVTRPCTVRLTTKSVHCANAPSRIAKAAGVRSHACFVRHGDQQPVHIAKPHQSRHRFFELAWQNM